MQLNLMTVASVFILLLAALEVLRARGKASRPLVLGVAILQTALILGLPGRRFGELGSREWALIAAGMILALAIDLYRAPEGGRGRLVAVGIGLTALLQVVMGSGLLTLSVG